MGTKNIFEGNDKNCSQKCHTVKKPQMSKQKSKSQMLTEEWENDSFEKARVHCKEESKGLRTD